MIDPLRDQLRASLADLPTQLTHGDCNVGNVLVHDGQVSGYIDLDHLPHSPRIRDLSVYLASRIREHIIAGDPDAMAGLLRHYVSGYHSRHPLTAREFAAIVPLMLTILIGNADWCLHGWVADPAGYRRNLQALEWIAPHYQQLAAAAP